MSSNKRQQARNEKALQDLMKSVPGNSTCSDCLTRNPGWASWSLGIFLCMRCAALHRKLGTHISKVKSLSMDSWTNEQVDNMRTIGNIKSNRIYNPTNIKPPVPFDVDEADSAMERFIRQKYMDKDLAGVESGHHRSMGASRRNTGFESDDDNPPPLPPKTGKGFFRSASNIFPLSSKTKKANAQSEAVAQSPYINDDCVEYSPTSPRVRSKPSRVFGTHVASSGTDEHENKMLRLRDMGFLDEKRNATVLKGLNGNLEKSIETLVRLGEGSSPGRVSTSRAQSSAGVSSGLTFPRSAGNDRPSVVTNSPWDLPAPPAMPQSAQSTGTYAQNNPFQAMNGSNPFGNFPAQSQPGVDQAFSGLSLSPNPLPTQHLFPNHTGGHMTQGYQVPPPMPMIPQQYQSNPFLPGQQMQQMQQPQPQPQQQQQQQQQQSHNYNPFLQSTQQPPQQMQQQIQQPLQQQTAQQSLYNGQNAYANNPYMTQQNQNQNFGQEAFYGQPQQQQPPQQAQYGFQQQQQQQFQQNNPCQQAQSQYQQYGAQPLQAQQTGRVDKSSILALYNYPQMAPTPPPQQKEPQPPLNTTPQQQYPDTPTSTQHMVSPGVGAGSKNPFMSAPLNGARHVSQESISVSADWQNGRHSPDAFASLSARSMR